MARTKERRRIVHESSTLEVFRCLSGMPTYSKILLDNKPDKSFTDFLRWLIEINFYNEKEEKITIKRLSADFKTDTPKTTKWINEIYHEIFELNYDKPELFQRDGIKVILYMNSYDSHCSFYTTMPVVPREFEALRFPFAHGKIGTDYFWVKKVEHEIEADTTTVTLWLEGGFLNKYREFALDKALFQGWIGFMEVHQKHSFELDEEIKKIYRN
jgi:hypothetical protein